MIIGHIDELEYLKNCLILSKSIRKSIFETSRIMKKIPFKFDSRIKQEELIFLADNGMSIKTLKVDDDLMNPDLLGNILMHVPNLEELNYHSDPHKKEEQVGNIKFELPLLKRLNLTTGNITNFLKNGQMYNIESINTRYQILLQNEVLTNFLCTQKKLKELRILSGNLIVDNSPYRMRSVSMSSGFPTRNIGNEINFKLVKLEILFDYYAPTDHLKDFLERHVETLKELKLTFIYNSDFVKFIFNKFENLEKMKLYTYYTGTRENLYTSRFFNKNFNYLKHYGTNQIYGTDVKIISQKCKNLNTLSCQSILYSDGTLEMLETLEVKTFNCSKNIYLILPNLKNLIVHTFESTFIDNVINLPKNIENIENFKIKCFFGIVRLNDTVMRCFDSVPLFTSFCIILKEFKKLKNFEHGSDRNKIHVDNVKKIIRISQNLKKEFLEILKKVFEDFKIEHFQN